MYKIHFQPSFELNLREVDGIVFDKDGILIDSEPYLKGNIIEALATYLKVDKLPENLLERVIKTFGQTHLKVARELYEILVSEGYSIDYSEEIWPEAFTNICRENWLSLAKVGTIKIKPGVKELFHKVRTFNIPTAMYTGTVKPMALVDLEYTLGVLDLFPDPFLITSDDERVTFLEKSEPLGWSLMAEELGKSYGAKLENIIAFEDRASGALGALKAGFKYVIVVPDEHDAPEGMDPTDFSSYWDKKNLMEDYLVKYPEAEGRLVFLRTLENLNSHLL